MSLFKELIGELNLFAQTFLGFLTFILWAWTGRIISEFHKVQHNPFKTFKATVFITEIPIAVGIGIVLGGFTEYLTNQEYISEGSLIQPALIAAGAYLGPKLLEDVWKIWLRSYGSGSNTTNIHIDTKDGNVKTDKNVSNQQIIDAVKKYMKNTDNDNTKRDDDENQ